jgi:multidrug efflux pump subunit AcrA (membrane-fusion protein)
VRRALAALVALALLSACRGREGSAASPSASSATPDAPTPVRVATVGRMTLAEIVSGPGHTAALSQQKVRAPFAGTLVDLRVVDGDLVRRGQAVGTIVSKESEAALSGAREMLREAVTQAQRADAERAIVLAERNLVRKPVLATADGPVLSHAAAGGDRVSEDQEIITIADASTIVFLADVPQNDLARIRPGQPAQVEIGGRASVLAGSVHSTLPGANAADFTGSVRIDLPHAAERLALGLFGSARVTVASRPAALVAPDAAVVRDDVTGVSRVVAVVNGRAHWLTVTPGLKQNGVTEISGPDVAEGTVVIESGMVGLPEGKSVSALPK